MTKKFIENWFLGQMWDKSQCVALKLEKQQHFDKKFK